MTNLELFSLSDYTAIVGRKKSERWVKKTNKRDSYDEDDDYEWYVYLFLKKITK